MARADRERREKVERERARLYPGFVARVRALKSDHEVRAFLLNEMPAEDTPGRTHFTSLKHFITHGTRPFEATPAEWALYEELAKRFVQTGEWKPAALEVFKRERG